MRAFTSRTAMLIGVATLAMACADSPTAPAVDATDGGPLAARIAYIDVTPDSASLRVGDTTRLRAVAYDEAGRAIDGEQIWWITDNNAIAGVTNGLVRGVAEGRARITAYARRGAATAMITVSNSAPAPAPAPSPAPTNAILTEGFESGAVGAWDDRGQPAQQRVVSNAALARSGSNVLEVTYPQGGGGGWLTKFFMPGYDSVTVTYWVRFDNNWQGGTYLLGLRGSRTDNQWSAFGRAGQCPNGTDYFNASLFADYNGNPGDTRFYTYYPGMNTAGCYGDTGAGRATYTAPLAMTHGVWHRVDMSVKLNRVGYNDGVQRFYVDGVLRGEWRNMVFRTSNVLTLNSVTFDFGSQGAPQTQRLWIDDITVVAQGSGTAPAPAPVTSVSLSPSTAALSVGQTAQLSATLRDASGNTLTGRTITWSSSNTAVATVTQAGAVTGVASGSATITATSEGVSGTAAVTVAAAAPVPVASVTVTPASASLTTGQGTQLQATLRDANGNILTGRTITWTSSNAAVATVSASGYVTSVAPGSATITATSGGVSGSAAISVAAPAPAPVASVAVTPASVSLSTGQGTQLQVALRDALGNTLSGRVVTWSSSNAAVATVSATGYVQAVGAGSATISATSEGVTGTASVGVTAPPVQGGTPNLWSKDFEDGSWSRMNAPFGAPSGPHALVSDATNCSGQRCYRYTVPSSALYSVNEFYVDGGRTYDELWWSVDFKLTNVIRGQLKGLRFTNGASSDLGGAYFMGRASDGSSGIGFAFGGEAGGVQLATGIWFGPRSTQFTNGGGVTYLENAISSGYHRLTIHYQRNGASQPRVRFWIDGRPVVQPQGAALAIDGYTWGASQGGANWVNGNAGEPSWLVPSSRGSSAGIGGLRMFDQMSSSGNSGFIYVDNMRVSTTPIAP